MNKMYIFLYVLACCICLPAEEENETNKKVIIEVSSVRINSEDTNIISFQMVSKNNIRIKQIATRDVTNLVLLLKKSKDAEWTTISKLFTPQNKDALLITSDAKNYDAKNYTKIHELSPD